MLGAVLLEKNRRQGCEVGHFAVGALEALAETVAPEHAEAKACRRSGYRLPRPLVLGAIDAVGLGVGALDALRHAARNR